MGSRQLKRSNCFSILFLIMFLISFTRPVQLPGEQSKQTISKSSNINVCLKPDPSRPSSDLLTCLGHQMLQKLQDLEEKDEFVLTDGVNMKRDESGPRDISNFLDKDPMDFRAIVEGASTLMQRRSMQWDMSFIHPGLNLRVGPTLTGNGVLEFVLDPKIRDTRDYEVHEPSTGRLITRQLLVPFLLGFKFQLATLLPLLFGFMVILSKKALILAKVAVIASSFFGYNSLFGGGQGYGNGYGHYGGPGLSAYGNRYNDYLFKNNDPRAEQFNNEGVDPYYVSSSNVHSQNNYNTGPAQTPEDLRDRLERLFAAKHGQDKPFNGRNFAWNQ